MTIQRLAGPRTHICWTPDATPVDQREQVTLVREKDLQSLIDEHERLRITLEDVLDSVPPVHAYGHEELAWERSQNNARTVLEETGR